VSEQGSSNAELRAWVSALEALLIDMTEAHAATRELLAGARAENLSNALLIEKLKAQIARLKRLTFGQSSERINHEIAQLELTLEELEHQQEIVDSARSRATVARPRSVRVALALSPTSFACAVMVRRLRGPQSSARLRRSWSPPGSNLHGDGAQPRLHGQTRFRSVMPP
jgi:hypothetical protein